MEPAAMGIRARMQGAQLDANPFISDTEAWLEWRRGWLVSTVRRRERAGASVDQPTPVSSPIEL